MKHYDEDDLKGEPMFSDLPSMAGLTMIVVIGLAFVIDWLTAFLKG